MKNITVVTTLGIIIIFSGPNIVNANWFGGWGGWFSGDTDDSAETDFETAVRDSAFEVGSGLIGTPVGMDGETMDGMTSTASAIGGGWGTADEGEFGGTPTSIDPGGETGGAGIGTGGETGGAGIGTGGETGGAGVSSAGAGEAAEGLTSLGWKYACSNSSNNGNCAWIVPSTVKSASLDAAYVTGAAIGDEVKVIATTVSKKSPLPTGLPGYSITAGTRSKVNFVYGIGSTWWYQIQIPNPQNMCNLNPDLAGYYTRLGQCEVNIKTWVTSDKVKNLTPAATCDSLTAVPTTTSTQVATTTLTWKTTNATKVKLTYPFGEKVVPANGVYTFAPLGTHTFKLTAYGRNGQRVRCEKTITVIKDNPYTVKNIKSVTRELVTTESKVYTKFTIKLNNGTTHVVKMFGPTLQDISSYKLNATGYKGTISAFKSKVVTPVTPKVLGASKTNIDSIQIRTTLIKIENLLRIILTELQ